MSLSVLRGPLPRQRALLRNAILAGGREAVRSGEAWRSWRTSPCPDARLLWAMVCVVDLARQPWRTCTPLGGLDSLRPPFVAKPRSREEGNPSGLLPPLHPPR